MTLVGESTNKDFEMIFKKLHDGLSSTKKKLENCKCKWEQCRQEFEDVELLFNHTCTHLPDTFQDTAPYLRNYACKWKKCTKTFTKIKSLKSHIREHTGSASDIFLQTLIKDQATALTTPSRSMRWHPLVIKWCLRMWTKSHAIYDEMRELSGLKLPTGRTLSDYKNYKHPESGWKEENIENMKLRLNSLKLPNHAIVGGLYFDEVKIKEGLV